MKLLVFFIFFMFLGAFFIISNENIKINSKENFYKFLTMYGDWIDQLFGNGRGVGGYVVKMEWLPKLEG
jgi:hypothetical protein